MRRLVCPSILAVIPLLGAPLAQAQNAACQSVQFGEKVVERFPRIRAACLDVVDKGGQKYAVIKADLMRTGNNTLYVRIKQPDGGHGETLAVKVKPGFRTLVEGKPVPMDELAVGQELTAYVKVTEPQMAIAADTESLEFSPLGPATPALAANAPSMPHTGSPLPDLVLFGVAMLGTGSVLALFRTRGRHDD